MMPIGALFICVLVFKVITVRRVEEEVQLEGHSFKLKKIFNFMVRYLCPVFVIVILITAILNVLGIVQV